jgi:RNA polymerase sigma factor (TIGR02999 family)
VSTRAPGPVTILLRAWSEGDNEAAQRVLPLVYQQLRQVARRLMRDERRSAAQPTELVHELWLRFSRQNGLRWTSRAQFLATAAHVMRQILVDDARRRLAGKRGAGAPHVTLGAASGLSANEPRHALALDAALLTLERAYPRPARALELRHFGGLTEREIGGELGVSDVTVRRDLRFAEAFLRRELAGARVAP